MVFSGPQRASSVSMSRYRGGGCGSIASDLTCPSPLLILRVCRAPSAPRRDPLAARWMPALSSRLRRLTDQRRSLEHRGDLLQQRPRMLISDSTSHRLSNQAVAPVKHHGREHAAHAEPTRAPTQWQNSQLQFENGVRRRGVLEFLEQQSPCPHARRAKIPREHPQREFAKWVAVEAGPHAIPGIPSSQATASPSGPGVRAPPPGSDRPQGSRGPPGSFRYPHKSEAMMILRHPLPRRVSAPSNGT